MIKKQEHPQTTKVHWEVVENPAAATSTTEYQAYLILQSNNRTRIEKKTVKQLIEQLENHSHKQSFLQDLKMTEKIDSFSEKSKKLITDMGNTEIFELCATSSETQCPDCAQN